MLIDKYNRIILDKLPENIASELKEIHDGTDNFENEELVEIYKENFNTLFDIIQEKHPDAIQPKKRLIRKAVVKTKLVKKTPARKKLVKKSKAATEKSEKRDPENCDEAKEKLKEIEDKKAKSAEKRAVAPKKKVSTAAREKQVKATVSLFKTKPFKGKREHAEEFAKDLIGVYRKHKLDAIADHLEKDIDSLIDKHYKSPAAV